MIDEVIDVTKNVIGAIGLMLVGGGAFILSWFALTLVICVIGLICSTIPSAIGAVLWIAFFIFILVATFIWMYQEVRDWRKARSKQKNRL